MISACKWSTDIIIMPPLKHTYLLSLGIILHLLHLLHPALHQLIITISQVSFLPIRKNTQTDRHRCEHLKKQPTNARCLLLNVYRGIINGTSYTASNIAITQSTIFQHKLLLQQAQSPFTYTIGYIEKPLHNVWWVYVGNSSGNISI